MVYEDAGGADALETLQEVYGAVEGACRVLILKGREGGEIVQNHKVDSFPLDSCQKVAAAVGIGKVNEVGQYIVLLMTGHEVQVLSYLLPVEPVFLLYLALHEHVCPVADIIERHFSIDIKDLPAAGGSLRVAVSCGLWSFFSLFSFHFAVACSCLPHAAGLPASCDTQGDIESEERFTDTGGCENHGAFSLP